MRTPTRWAVAIRRPDGRIVTESHDVPERWAAMRSSILRGIGALAEAMSIGLEALRISVRESTGIAPTMSQMRSTLAIVGTGMLALFVAGPAIIAGAWPDRVADIAEPALRTAVLLVYLFTIARTDAARRLFGFHGAEHKVIAARELHGRTPTRDEAIVPSPVHPRCGTSFIVLFVIASGFVHALVPRSSFWVDVAARVALIVVDAGVAYEVMRLTARAPGSAVARLVSLPGRALQHLTTREPDADQLDVALAALGALDQG